jgi:hypothetical protein
MRYNGELMVEGSRLKVKKAKIQTLKTLFSLGRPNTGWKEEVTGQFYAEV